MAINLGASSIGENLDLMATTGQPLQQPGTVPPTPTTAAGTLDPQTIEALAKIAPTPRGPASSFQQLQALGAQAGSTFTGAGQRVAQSIANTPQFLQQAGGALAQGIRQDLLGGLTGGVGSITPPTFSSGAPGSTVLPQQLADLLAAQGQTLPGLGRVSSPAELQAQQLTATSIDPTQFSTPTDTTTKQAELIAALEARAQGRGGPSLAELQLQQAQQAALNQQLALAASATGQNAALAQRQVAQQAALSGQNLAQQGAILRAQEQQAAREQLAQALAGARGQELQSSQLQAQIAMQNAQREQAAALANQQAALEAQQFNIGRAMAAEQANIGISQQEQQAQQAREQALINALQTQQGLEIEKQKVAQDAEIRQEALRQQAEDTQRQLQAADTESKRRLIGSIAGTAGSVLAGGLT